MRLKQSDLQDTTVLRPEENEDGYVGTKVTYVPNRTIKANIQPAQNQRSIELYGERVKRMYTLLLNPPDVILPEERVVISGRVYEVVSAPAYSGHSVVTVEEVPDGTN